MVLFGPITILDRLPLHIYQPIVSCRTLQALNHNRHEFEIISGPTLPAGLGEIGMSAKVQVLIAIIQYQFTTGLVILAK